MRRQYFLKKSQAIVEGQQQELGAALPPRAHFSGGQEGRNLFLLNIEGFEHHHLLPEPCAGSLKRFYFLEIKPITKEHDVLAVGGLKNGQIGSQDKAEV
jgi:hypothetical protein